MIKICWIQHSSERLLVGQIADYLKKEGIEVKIVGKFLEEHEKYLIDGLDSYFISDVFNKKELISQQELEDLDLKYGPPGVKSICNSDIQLSFFYKNNQALKEQVVGHAYKFWEDFFNKHNINYVIARDTATFATRTANNVARYKGIPMVVLEPGPGEGYFVMNDGGEQCIWSELSNVLSKGKKKLTSDQQSFVYDFIKKRIPIYDNKNINIQIQYKVNLATFLLRVTRGLISITLNNKPANRKKDPIRIAALLYGRYKLRKKVIYRCITSKFFRFDKPRDEKFIYFPIYTGRETGYLVSNYYWATNELSLIREVAESMPTGFFLYAKLHPLNAGDFTYRELKQLKKIPNIKIIHPSISSQYLIEKSKAVFILGSSAGWEAYLSKKPVLCLGAPYFSYSSLIYKIKSISQLSDIIYKAIKNGSEIYNINKEEWLWFIYSVISTCGQGDIRRRIPGVGFTKYHKDAKKIASYILQKIKRDLNIKNISYKIKK